MPISPDFSPYFEVRLPWAAFPKRAFQLKGDDDVPGEWDENRLSQLVSNLVGNAVQHGAGNSTVTITAHSRGEGVEISVHNEGTPIPPDKIPKLFDCFYQLDTEPETGSTSLGLGLYICKEIVAAHKGTIDLRSSANEGTTFIVRLPSTREREAGRAA